MTVAPHQVRAHLPAAIGAAQQDDGRGGQRGVLLDAAADLEPRDLGQLHVEHEDVRRAFPDLLQGLAAASGLDDGEAARRQTAKP